MSTREASPARDAVNDLYDHGCDLVEAAAALHSGSDAPGAGRAVPAVTSCLEGALRELALTVAGLERAALAEDEQHLLSSRRRRTRRHQGFVNLEVALHDAADAAAAARALSARTLSDAR